MNDNHHNHDSHEESVSHKVHKMKRPYWRYAHHDWRFWVAVILMIFAMFYYVMSDGFSLRLRGKPPVSGVQEIERSSIGLS